MKKKALLTLASFGLLATVIIYSTIAWYTNIANVTGMTFDVAEYKFEVNYKPDNFIIQLDDYLNVTDDKAEPVPLENNVKEIIAKTQIAKCMRILDNVKESEIFDDVDRDEIENIINSIEVLFRKYFGEAK